MLILVPSLSTIVIRLLYLYTRNDLAWDHYVLKERQAADCEMEQFV
jgi:hypothetical protein